MTGFELRTSVNGSDRSTNWATVTSQVDQMFGVKIANGVVVFKVGKGAKQCDQMFELKVAQIFHKTCPKTSYGNFYLK